MKIPLKKTFTKEIDDKISDEEILNNFIINLKIKSFTTFNKTNNNLTASNDYKSIWDFNKAWKDNEKVSIKILNNQRKKRISYVLNFSGLFEELKKLLTFYPLVFFLLYLSGKFDDTIKDFGLIGIFVFILVFIIGIQFILAVLLILRHRNIFRNTLKYGAGNIKYYNWDKIMKNKTNKELDDIIKGRSNYSDRVIVFAKKEFDKRNSDNKIDN